MSFQKFPVEIINHILSSLDTKSSISLIKVNKSLNQIGEKYGYIKKLHAGQASNDDILTCVMRYYKHKRTINELYILGLDNPQNWFGGSLSKRVVFQDCRVDEFLDPPISNTESLSIHDLRIHNNPYVMKINWEKFPKLRILSLLFAKSFNIA